MQTRRPGSRQEVPEDFAVQLRGLRDTDNTLLNALLAASRDAGWSAPALAGALDMKPPAVSKRVERARDHTLSAELAERLAGIAIPRPVRVMLDGRQLPAERIAELKRMREIASGVNGATKTGARSREVSKQLADELNQLINVENFSYYYLAAEMGVSHRAITSRLERHGYRSPCPSVAGTASGGYHHRRIGDPGQGAPRLSTTQRNELRAAWDAYRNAVDHVAHCGATRKARDARLIGAEDQRAAARSALRELLIPRLTEGFTLANLAQAISTREHRVRYPQLRQVLGETNWSEPGDE